MAERVAAIPFVVHLVTSKLGYPAGTWVIVVTSIDFVVLPVLLGLLMHVTYRLQNSKRIVRVELSALIMSALWFAGRQASLGRSLFRLGLGRQWLKGSNARGLAKSRLPLSRDRIMASAPSVLYRKGRCIIVFWTEMILCPMHFRPEVGAPFLYQKPMN